MIYLSDLHLGDGSQADDFGPRGGLQEVVLISQLRAWRQAGKRICLVGDIFELWQADYVDILRAHGPLVEELFACADAYVIGNHDADLLGGEVFGLEGIPHLVAWPVLVEHGHSLDPYVGRWPWAARAVSWLGGAAERLLHRDADLWAERLSARIARTGRASDNARYVGPLSREAWERGCEVVVFGHTHKPLLDYRDPATGVVAYNCGTWTNGHRDYVEINGDQ